MIFGTRELLESLKIDKDLLNAFDGVLEKDEQTYIAEKLNTATLELKDALKELHKKQEDLNKVRIKVQFLLRDIKNLQEGKPY